MIDIYLKDKAYHLPERWEELTPDQFTFLLDLLNEYTTGKRDADSVGINFGMYLLGIKKPRLMSPKQEMQFYENLAWLGEKAAFWWRVVYEKPEALDHIDPELKKQIKTTLPEDLPDTPEVRVLRRHKKWLEPDFIFSSNILPFLYPSLNKDPKTLRYRGYRFTMEDNLLSTTLTADQFSHAMTIAGQYGATKSESLLNLLCAILYYQYDQVDFDFEKSKEMAPVFNDVPRHIKQGVFINFMGVKEYLTTRTKYAILFRPSNEKTPEINVGFNNNIYTLAKIGYGDAERFNLVKLMDLMLKELIDAVRSMKEMEMELDKILSATGLTIHQLNLIAP